MFQFRVQFFVGMLAAVILTSCGKGSCSDGELNQDETSVDCGGECGSCGTCSDGIQNQDEVDVDCGGVCEPCAIYFPESGSYGTNILNEDSVSFPDDSSFSMRAELKEGSTFKAVLYNTDGGMWFYAPFTQQNITVTNIDGGTQSFEAIGSGVMQVQIGFNAGFGTCVIQFYENSTSATKTKTISWS